MELGDLSSALAELDLISKLFHDHYDVLQVRWHILNRMEDWEDCLRISRQMRMRPILASADGGSTTQHQPPRRCASAGGCGCGGR